MRPMPHKSPNLTGRLFPSSRWLVAGRGGISKKPKETVPETPVFNGLSLSQSVFPEASITKQNYPGKQ